MQKSVLSKNILRASHPTTARVRLFEMLTKAFLLQLRLLPWPHLTKRERKRIAAILAVLESDLQLAQYASASQPFFTDSYSSNTSPVRL